MKPTFYLAAAATLLLAACSAPTGQDVQQRFQQTTIGETLYSPEANALKEQVVEGVDTAIYHAGEAALTVAQKWKISKFPPMQPVIVRYGSGIASSFADKNRTASKWDPTREHNYVLELPNGEKMIIRQAGPQFHQNQMATLLRHGLTVTLVP
jgi:hypothetical protein